MNYFFRNKKALIIFILAVLFSAASTFLIVGMREDNLVKNQETQKYLNSINFHQNKNDIFSDLDKYVDYVKDDLMLKADVIIEGERILEEERLAAVEAARLAEEERLAAVEAARLAEEERLRVNAQSYVSQSNSSGNSSSFSSVEEPASSSNVERYNELCLGSSCGHFGNYYGNDLNSLQAMIDTNIVVAKEGFSGTDGFSTYFMGHNHTGFNYLRYSLSINDIIDVYDSGGTKHSYKMIQRIETRNDGTYNGSPTYVYGGVGPIDALYDGISEEVIYIQYCVDGTGGKVSYVWSGVKV